MMECADARLPMNEPVVFKAFCAWRLNAKDFAAASHLDENYPVNVAQVINSANRHDTNLMALAMLMSVPEPAWGVMEKRFGKEMVERLEEAQKHVRTGYTYIDGASDEVKGLALAAAILSLDSFIKLAGMLDETLDAGEMGKDARDIVHDLTMPECKMYEHAAEKISGTKYTALEELCLEKLAEYRAVRKEHFAALSDMGMPFADEEDDDEVRNIPFEMQGLLDAPQVRKAYEILTHDTRVELPDLANALSVGRLLTDLPGPKDASVIAAGMMSAGIRRLMPEDKEFLPGKLDAQAVSILTDYNIRDAYMKSADGLVKAPAAVRQLAVASGVVALDWARKKSESTLEYIDDRPGTLPREETARLKLQTLAPVHYLANAVSGALLPLLGATESPQLEDIFLAEVKHATQFVKSHMPAEKQPAAGGRIAGRRKPPPGRNFNV